MSDIADFHRYAAARDPELRQRLIEENLPLVYSQAAKLAKTLPRSIRLDDLIQWGSIGLIDAVGKFDPSRGFAFSTYGVMRIHGSMLDGLQTLEWLPKARITRLRDLGRAQDALEAEGADGTVAQIAERMGTTPAEVHELLQARATKAVSSLDIHFDAPEGEDDGFAAHSWQSVIGDQEPSAELAEISSRVVAALRQLDEQEALIIERIYCDGMTLKDLALEPGRAPGTVTSLHDTTLARIRETLALFGPSEAAA